MANWRVRGVCKVRRREALEMGVKHINEFEARRSSFEDIERDRQQRQRLSQQFEVDMSVLLPNGVTAKVVRVDKKTGSIFVKEPFGRSFRERSYAPSVLTKA